MSVRPHYDVLCSQGCIFVFSGTDVTINSLSDCGRTYDLNDHSEVNIQFYQKSSYEDCEITIKEHSSDDYPRMCIKPKTLDFNGCTLKVQIHMGLVIDGYEDEVHFILCILIKTHGMNSIKRPWAFNRIHTVRFFFVFFFFLLRYFPK